MPVPLLIAAPAAVATLAYLNARIHFSTDLGLITSLLAGHSKTSFLEKRGQISGFYLLEKYAKSKSHATHPLLLYQGKTWTYKEVYDTAIKYGTWLKTRYAIAPGENVAMDFMNSPQFIFFWLGIWSLGAYPVFINYNLGGEALLHCIKISKSRLLLVDVEVKFQFTPEVLDVLAQNDAQSEVAPIEIVFFDREEEHQVLEIEGIREPDSSRAGMKAYEKGMFIFTSGTTGLPKMAIVSWKKAYLGAKITSDWLGLQKSDIFYSCMPLYHTAASVLGFFTCLIGGCTFAIGHKFSTRTFWPEVRSSKATMIQYVGETCRYLLAAEPEIDPVTGENLDRKHVVRIALGNGLRPDVWNRFKERFGIETIGEYYAATESPSAFWNLSSNDYSSGAIGRNGVLASVFLGSKVAVVELDWEAEEPLRNPENGNLCRKVKTGDPGELLYKLDAANIGGAFQGYFNNPQATNKKVMRDVLTKGDAFFRTGDVVRWDAEGRWWFCDRIGDTFRWKSENVSTAEVSEALGTHPSVSEANVYGVELPHHDGRAGCAAVVFSGVDIDQKLLEGMAAHANQRLPRFAVPVFLRAMGEMPATGTNKQQKHVLRAQGVSPQEVRESGDRVFWLKGGKYVEMEDEEWAALKAGKVRL